MFEKFVFRIAFSLIAPDIDSIYEERRAIPGSGLNNCELAIF
jgi:hypothetical protein